jgi:starch phosphorylase
MKRILFPDLPEELAVLVDLALDLRWTWSHEGDQLWRMISPEAWEATRNPWTLLPDVSREQFQKLTKDPVFRRELGRLVAVRRRYLGSPTWYGRTYPSSDLKQVASFSLEFGLGEGLPLYAGGLGILAGDHLKTASDLGVPMVGVGLLYQVGYFRQIIDAGGRQREMYPYNDPASLPIQPVQARGGGWLHVPLDLPGRTITLRVWQAQVGRSIVYLLDSNDPMNSPVDRGITGELYGGGPELRLAQELVLGIGGWRALEAMRLGVDVCHLNEGHAAFVVLERARCFMEERGVSFRDALRATRAGNVFSTHTPMPVGFDTYSPELVEQYLPHFGEYMRRLGITSHELLALGRRNPADPSEPFNMAYLAMRGSALANGVSRLHATVSRRIFGDLFPRWPEVEVPVTHVTNGVHVPTWDSRWADLVWTEACGKARWLGSMEPLPDAIRCLSDEKLWALRAAERQDLVRYARERLVRQVGQRGATPEAVAQARLILHADALTLGFARRFAGYKRPNLLLHDPDRLARLLTIPDRPVQIIVAGKAHPRDEEGKQLVRAWAEFVQRPAVRSHAVYLEDYDISLAQELVQGVDVWINTPRRPWEACGTSGMKVLVNGGLNLSELDGWWAEAYRADAGWVLDGGPGRSAPDSDAAEAEQLYEVLEREVVPEFYSRDGDGIPKAWVARIRASMASLAPEFSSNRMMRDYVERHYLPAASAFRRRSANQARLARDLQSWTEMLERHWGGVRFRGVRVAQDGECRHYEAEVDLGSIPPEMIRVELYADPADGEQPLRHTLTRAEEVPGATNTYVYRGSVSEAPSSSRRFTPRVIPSHPEAYIPIEAPFIAWPE